MKGFAAMLLLLTLAETAVAQQRFAEEIMAFKKQDSVQKPPAGAIVFTGSSSFRMWENIQSDFPGYTIINRAFGGSTLPEVIHYAKDVILPYKPRQVIIYCGDNDLASSETVTADMVVKRFQTLFYLVRKALPKTTISFVSIKPSPSREHLLPKMKLANASIKRFLSTQKSTSFIDVFTPMLGKDKKPRPDIFLEDNLHMNRKGYLIWQKTIQPYLVK